ncbi:MAG: hypothetical protein QOG01_970 [Pseudonocardiales bacterium]|jgi:hypothetical protein|nr:hypothetical protein [Pseudonocardiales bacterium]
MRKFSRKNYIAAGAAAVIVAAGAGTALAYWTSTGSGTGSATTGTSSNFTVLIDSTTLADLTPGGPTDVVAFHVTNPSTGHQKFTSALASVVDTSNSGCTAADFAITATTAAYGNLDPSATVAGSFKLQMIDTGVGQDACKGVTVHLKVDVS